MEVGSNLLTLLLEDLHQDPDEGLGLVRELFPGAQILGHLDMPALLELRVLVNKSGKFMLGHMSLRIRLGRMLISCIVKF
jgi:hypothetical protein